VRELLTGSLTQRAQSEERTEFTEKKGTIEIGPWATQVLPLEWKRARECP